MGFLDIIKQIVAAVKPAVAQATQQQVPDSTPVRQLSNRYGSFIVPDVYPPDLDDPHTPQLDIPPFQVLPGLVVMDKECIGAEVKATEGLGWGKANEDWFRQCWPLIKSVGGERYGDSWFRACYHFLRFSMDGAKQADYFCDVVDSAGGWDVGDLMPCVDVEEGGQGSWAGGEKLENIKDPVKRARLTAELRTCVTAFVKRFKERTGLRIAVYGRGIFRDLQMTDCHFGQDAVENPAYTQTMPPMAQYVIPRPDITWWQICGDGSVVAPGFPSKLPGWGATDYSVYINGAIRTGLADLRDRSLAKKP